MTTQSNTNDSDLYVTSHEHFVSLEDVLIRDPLWLVYFEHRRRRQVHRVLKVHSPEAKH